MKSIMFILVLFAFPFVMILFGCAFLLPCMIASFVLDRLGEKDMARNITDTMEHSMRWFNHVFFTMLTGEKQP